MYRGFPLDCVELIRCQYDGAELMIASGHSSWGSGFALRGSLECSACKNSYAIVDGILDLATHQRRRDVIVETEVTARNAAAGTYDALFSDVRNEMEIPSTLKGLDLQDKTIVEYGCGTGRITTHLFHHASRILGIDFAEHSLRVLAGKIPSTANVGLVLADATQTALADSMFDIALAVQVLEHVPTSSARLQFYHLVRQSLVIEGVLVVSVYHQDFLRRLRKLPTDGYHDNGIFYHYFSVQDFRAEVESHFDLLGIYPVEIPIPFGRRLGLPLVFMSRLLERTPILNRLGHLLVGRAVKIS